MPNLNQPFDGSTLIIPGAYYGDNVSAALPNTPPTTPPMGFIGYAYGGDYLVPNTYSSMQNLQAAMRGGPAQAFIQFLANPSPELNGAQLVTFIQSGHNTPATYTLTTSGATGILLTTMNQGPPSNLMQVTVQPSTVAVANSGIPNAALSRKITLFDGASNTIVSQDNLGAPLELFYLGTATSGVSYTVAATSGVATTLTLTSPTAGETKVINLGSNQYATVSAVAQYINGTGVFSAQVISQGLLPSSMLDAGTGALVSGGVTPQFVAASLNDALYWFNNGTPAQNDMVVATLLTTGTVGTLLSTPAVHFTGATGVPPFLSDYAAAFNAMLSQNLWTICADSTSSSGSILALGSQHAQTASQPAYGKWRRFFSGSNPGESTSTALFNATMLDTITSSYAYPGIYRTDLVTGINTLFGGLYAAAAAAAMATGNQVATPLTYKHLTSTGVELALTTTQIDLLQQGGVMPIAITDQSGVPNIVSDFTSWLIDNNPENVFNQQVACRWWVAYSLTNACRPYTGTIADQLDETKILNACKACLNQLVYVSGNNGVINSWDPSTLQLVYTGGTQTAAVQVNIQLVGQNRFITIYAAIQPLNFSITATAAAA